MLGKTKGWTLLLRETVDLDFWPDIPCRVLWIHLLMQCEWQEPNRGTLHTTFRTLAADAGLSFQQTRTALAKLADGYHITVKTGKAGTIISLVDYDYFAGSADYIAAAGRKATEANKKKLIKQHTQAKDKSP